MKYHKHHNVLPKKLFVINLILFDLFRFVCIMCMCICLSACVQNFIPSLKQPFLWFSHDMKIVAFFNFQFLPPNVFFTKIKSSSNCRKQEYYNFTQYFLWILVSIHIFLLSFLCVCFVHKESKKLN